MFTRRNKVRRRWVKLRLTQEELARIVGVTTLTIRGLENHPIFNPRLQTLRAIAKALGFDVAYLID
jgi:DNA-binding XRE family transcriptional regulator